MFEIKEKIFEENKKETLSYLEGKFANYNFTFDHFGIVATKEDYQGLKCKVEQEGKVYQEFIRSDKKWFTGKLNGITYEIYGPIGNKHYTDETLLDHVSFMVDDNDLGKLKKLLLKSIITRFHVKTSCGIKIKPQKNLIIEIRNDNVIDSIDNFLTENDS